MSVGIKRSHNKESVNDEIKPKKVKSSEKTKLTTKKPSPPGAILKPGGGKKVPGKFSKPTGPKKFGDKNEKPESNEKTDWNKLKKEKKELKLKRKKAKDTYEVAAEVKQIYEKLKCKATPNKKELVEELFKILKKSDCVKKFVMAHDTARIIQCLLKNASPELRTKISEELLPIIVEMSLSKYAHFCVLRMVKYGSHVIREKIIQAMYGNIVKLATHSISNGIIDVIYLTWASNKQKAYMRQEFYGGVYKTSKDDSVKKLTDTYANAPTMKSAVLSALKLNLEHAANKKLVDNCLVHHVLLEYLEECSEEQRGEMVTLFSPLIPSIITTREGCRAAILCFWHSPTKERRGIVKGLREHLTKITSHEQGHVLILAIANTMDDTKAIKKSIFDHLYEDLESIVDTQWGRKVIEWFVQPADKECFHPQLISFLEEGLQYGKKDKDIRRKEILEQIQEPLAQKICENPSFWIKNGHLGLTTAIILKNLDENNFNKAASALAGVVCEPDWSVNVKDEEEDDVEKNDKLDEKTKAKIRLFTKGEEAAKTAEKMLGIEHPGLHIALKKIIKNDKERSANSEPTFGSQVVKGLSEEALSVWVELNRACFILLNIYENCQDETVQSELKELLSTHLSTLKKQKHTGAKLLMDKLGLKK